MSGAEEKKKAKRPASRSAAGGKAKAPTRSRPSRELESPAKPKSKRGGGAVVTTAKPTADQVRREASKTTALLIALAALDKKAERVEIVDIGEKVDYADFLVVMTGRSDRQVQAIAQGIEEALSKKGIRTQGQEGVHQGHWVLIDVSDVIVHVFLEEARRYYDLEGLWLDAPRVPTPTFVPPASTNTAHEG